VEGRKLWGEAVDSVIMLTWSDWKTEPRSNRYHYATRFARHVPVFFVQPDSLSGKIWFEQIELNIRIVHVPASYGAEEAQELATALYRAGCRKPLLWIYNVHFEEYIRRSNALVRVLHATENYFTSDEDWEAPASVRDPLKRVLDGIDLLVAVSRGVLDDYLVKGGYNGSFLLSENGCDALFWHQSGAYECSPVMHHRPVAFYQGGINKRLDFPLLISLARRLPTWEFWFCGNAESDPEGWADLKSLPNVRYFGIQSVEGIASLARQSVVGLIPFEQNEFIRVSLPLKAYEYVACGMPVVSVPIDSLARRSDLFRIAVNADEFAQALEELAPTRGEPGAIEHRLAAAAAESYDKRFDILIDTLARYVERVKNRRTFGRRYSILLLYDDHATHVKTIAEHIEAFQRYTGHDVVLAPATRYIPVVDDIQTKLDLSVFDAVVIHYSVRLTFEDYLSQGMAQAIGAYDGPKLLFIQDEYENTEIARRWIERLGVDTVFTCVPLEQVEQIYPRERFPGVDFVGTLTGYVPEDISIDEYALPLVDRPTLIGYRGRHLPYNYGDLAQEKHRIGIETRKRAIKLGLAVDIEVDDSCRIYGKDWYRFLGSCRATLGTESGSNVFDDDGELKRLAEQHRSMSYENFREMYLKGREGRVRMNQISPKIFEAIRLRTALVLFEGDYSGIVEPDLHYIPLKKDFSNFDDVVKKIQSLDYIEALTERAYRDIIDSGRWSYKVFAEDFSRYLSNRLLGRRPRARIVSAPMLAFQGEGSPAELWPRGLMNGLASGQILDSRLGRDQVLEAIGSSDNLEVRAQPRAEPPRSQALTVLRFWARQVPGARRAVNVVRRLVSCA